MESLSLQFHYREKPQKNKAIHALGLDTDITDQTDILPFFTDEVRVSVQFIAKEMAKIFLQVP